MADENGRCSVGVPIPIRVGCIWIGRYGEVAEGWPIGGVGDGGSWTALLCSSFGLVTQGLSTVAFRSGPWKKA
jgi:hypothetical protein